MIIAPVFSGVKCYFSPSFSNPRFRQLAELLTDCGGVVTREPADATHVVSNTHRPEGWQIFRERSVPICTDLWIERSVLQGNLQPISLYSIDPRMIFSGVIACAADLQPQDIATISREIQSLGGAWRATLSKDVTHVFALTTDSEIYSRAMASDVEIVVLMPHWFDDVVKLGMGKLDTEPYQWPNPSILQPFPPSKPEATQKSRKIDFQKRSLFTTASADADSTPKTMEVFDQRRVLLSTSLELGARREAIECAVERAEGIIVQLETPEEELYKINECDILVTRYRSGKAYFKAARAGKTIGTLAWLFHVVSIGALTSPLDQILHYPIPRKHIQGFSNHKISITNYTGEARDYLKRLISAMGAKFTPTMSRDNTVLIASQIDGLKAEKAQSWHLPVVNHLWLEDCFLYWRDQPLVSERYISFPKGTDLATRLGERGLLENIEARDELDRAELEEDEEVAEGSATFGDLQTQDRAQDAWAELAMEMRWESPAR